MVCTEKTRDLPLPLAATVLPRENFSQGAEAQRSEALSTQNGHLGSQASVHIKSCVRRCGLTVRAPERRRRLPGAR